MYQKTNTEITAPPARVSPRVKPAAGGGGSAALDATLGFALLRDRRICIWQKARALATGAAIVAGMILATAVGARLTGIGGRSIDLSIDGAVLAAGTLLFGALLLKRLAPREMVSRVRCEQFRVIPLRKRTVDAVVRQRSTSHSDALAALGYAYPTETKEYAVIPRRAR
jgi:hypothetical protein